jgi:hypothetical protein
MAIDQLPKGITFGPEEVAIISTAFEGVCRTLGLTERNDPVVEMVATAILRAADFGTGSADQIQQRALMVLRSSYRGAETRAP